MGTALVSINKVAADEYVRRYQQSTKSAIESILNMGEAVYGIYTKFKSKEFSDRDLEYFCKSVNLDSKGSTFRKYNAIGRNADKFRLYMDKLPSSFSVLYEMATLDADDFERFVVRNTFSKGVTLEHLRKIMGKSAALTKGKLLNPPALRTSPLAISRVIKKINRLNISVVRDLPESEFNQVIGTLTEYKNRGWIRFDDPEITQYLNEDYIDEEVIDDDGKNFGNLKYQALLESRA
jgi:hypothetical protein